MKMHKSQQINPWTLRIKDSAARVRYREENAQYTLGQFRLAVTISAFMYIGMTFVDRLIYRDISDSMMIVRLFYVFPVLMIILVLTKFTLYNKYIVLFHLLTEVVVGTGILIIIYIGRHHTEISRDYVSILLVYFLIYAFLEVPYLYSGIIGLVLAIIYILMDYYILLTPTPIFIQTVFMMMGANFIGIGIAYNREKYSKEINLLRQQLAEIAIKDALTGLNNRHYFEEICVPDIQLFMEKSERIKNVERRMGDDRSAQYGLIMLAIDYFKQVNDSYGHTSGDLVLKEFADLLQANTRKSDDAIRIGGEEFLMVIKSTTEEYLIHFVKKLGRLIQEHDFSIEGGKHINCTVSMGMVVIPNKQMTDIDSLMRYVDRALYRSKDAGRNKGHKAFSLQNNIVYKVIEWASTKAE